MSLNRSAPLRVLAAIAISFFALSTPDLGAQVIQPGLQPGLTRAPDSARKISLDEAISLAQRNSPDAIQAEGTERTSKAARTSAIGAILPSASLSAGHVIQVGGGVARLNQNGEVIAVAQKPTNSLGVSLNMTLFDGGQRLYDLRTARSQIEAAEANRVAVKYNVALGVKQQYYAVLAAIESEDAARLQMAQASEQFKTSVAKVRAGVATRSDSLRGVIQVGNAQLALITAQSNKESADAALTRLVGSPVPVTADPTSVQENMAALPDSAELAKLALIGPAVQQAQANVDAAKQATKASKATYLPSLNASYSRTGSGTDPRFGLGDDPFSYSGRHLVLTFVSDLQQLPARRTGCSGQGFTGQRPGDLAGSAARRDATVDAEHRGDPRRVAESGGAGGIGCRRAGGCACTAAALQHRGLNSVGSDHVAGGAGDGRAGPHPGALRLQNRTGAAGGAHRT